MKDIAPPQTDPLTDPADSAGTGARDVLRRAEAARKSTPRRHRLDRPRAPHEALGIDVPGYRNARGSEIPDARVPEVARGLSRAT